ncbi:MAG: hypothetical protein HZB26_09085 [Candidatus Hydrogenedentes bacterium]|nr:hypothetical protein [Candidatus Hydrogenedentota bacterium]
MASQDDVRGDGTTFKETPPIEASGAEPRLTGDGGGCWKLFAPILVAFECIRAVGDFYRFSRLPVTYRHVPPHEGSRLYLYWGMWASESILYIVFTKLTYDLFLLGRRTLVDRFVLVVEMTVCAVVLVGPLLPMTRNLLLAWCCIRVLYWLCYLYELRSSRDLSGLLDDPESPARAYPNIEPMISHGDKQESER